MMTMEQFNAVVDQIMSLGYDEATACDFARRIGDTPELDEEGRTVVRAENGEVEARLALLA